MDGKCGNCGAEIEDATIRCPQCGTAQDDPDDAGKRESSIAPEGESKTLWLSGAAVSTSYGWGTPTIIRHWTNLLESAEELFKARHYGAAVVVAQSACEVIMARAIAAALDKHKVPELIAEFIDDALWTYSPKNSKTCKLYNDLTGDKLGIGNQQAFWEPLSKLVKHRNACAHKGVDCTEAEARTGIDAAKAFVEHVEKHNRLQG